METRSSIPLAPRIFLAIDDKESQTRVRAVFTPLILRGEKAHRREETATPALRRNHSAH